MPPNGQPPPQEYARVVLIIILLFFLYTSPDQPIPAGNGFGPPHDYAAERAARARHSLDILNSSRHGDFSPKAPDTPRGEASRYLNLTGFREEDNYAWDRLSAFKKRGREFSVEARGEDGAGKALRGEVWENVTGVVVGRWTRYTEDLNGEQRHRTLNLSEIAPGIDWAFRDEEYWTRNITGSEGKMQIRIDERNVEGMTFDLDKNGVDINKEVGNESKASWYTDFVREVEATVVVQDETSSGDGWEMKVHGVHWPRKGVMLMTTTSEKFAGVFSLPHLTADVDHYITSQKLLNKTLEKTVEGMEKVSWGDNGNPWTATPTNQGDATMPAPHCEFVVYAQVYPVDSDQPIDTGGLSMNTVVHEIEQELRFPNGAPISHVPDMQMSTVMFSPDCGFMLESKGPPSFAPTDGKHLRGKKQEVWLQEIQYWLHIFALTIFGQILLLKIQSKEASTPSTVGRVSLYTIAMMLMADALLFSSMSLVSATITSFFPSSLLTSFSALMSVALGVRFIGVVYNVQEPERLERQRARQAEEATLAAARAASIPAAMRATSTPAPAPIITAAGADIAAPRPTPPTTNVTPIIIPSDQDIDAEIAENATAPPATLPTTNTPAANTAPQRSNNFGAVYLKFILCLTFILFTSLSATTWPVSIRNWYIHIISFAYLSFWIPQIRRNIIRNCRKALLWKFIVGQSILRLLPFAYFYLKEDNVMFAETDWKAFCVLGGWVWIQIWILVAQEVLGPRWGLPKGWTEEGWDYHPILREDNIEAGGLPIGLVQIPASPTLERANTGDEQATRKKKDGSVRSVDCAICMQVLEVPVVAAGEDATGTGVAGMLARRQYMVTPCRHVFHSACLEGWMRFRLQCPICRENLPPL
ncbi:related to TUL1 RING-domain E3 ubiquitin ligase [Phialocephala subalpina]|uniref:DSC E3 ubiquitin ligase complex subunit A n=1 Tax=Phialocephala subalpina TaxID=576137 RepID=A0A1L7WX43_9HELO|nr:related to TUL1 RING-domain E3 ubiquitin ligase [Phialocephala subalpina]